MSPRNHSVARGSVLNLRKLRSNIVSHDALRPFPDIYPVTCCAETWTHVHHGTLSASGRGGLHPRQLEATFADGAGAGYKKQWA